MADRADAADARGDAGHFAVGPALAELLEAAELDDVELGVGDVAGVVHEDADLGVALDAGHGVNDDALSHNLSKLELRAFELRLSPSSTWHEQGLDAVGRRRAAGQE